MLHSWDTVGVVRNQRDQFHGSVCGKNSHVKADPHINAFLFKRRSEIGIFERSTGCKWDVLQDVSPEL
jgi:hypothetical protein